MAWAHTIKIRHLLTEGEDHKSVSSEMNAIADILEEDVWFNDFDLKPFRKIPKGDSVFGPVDYANVLLTKLYDYCDQRRIWVEF